MNQNPIYMCISWCSKICWFPVKECWCQQNSRNVSRDLYIFFIFLREGITVQSFIIAGYVWWILRRVGQKGPPPILEQPWKNTSWIAISHINYWDQVNSWKNLWKFWNGPLCRNKSGPSPLLNVAVYWQSSDTETCVKKLSQILANIDNGGRGIGLRTYLRYCRFCETKSKSFRVG